MSQASKNKQKLKYHLDAEEFIPFAAHFDDQTLITKNGELIQVLKINGFASEYLERPEDFESLRSKIRKAILNNIKTDNFAIWLHTIRVQRDISTGGNYTEKFSHDLNEKWVEKNGWRAQFVNELYLTIIIEGENLSLKNPVNLIDNLFEKKTKQHRIDFLYKSLKQLNLVCNNILKELDSFGCKKLSIFKRDGIYYSEIISFINKIINLKEFDIPLAPADLSSIMPSHRVNFQNNVLTVEGETGRHFGAIFSVKEYQEVPLSELEKLLSLQVNFIITESFHFVDGNLVRDQYKDQKKLYDISGKKYLLEISGINEIFEKQNEEKNKFGKHQIIITVLEDSAKMLQNSISTIVDTLREIGVVFIREDLFLENCYWSMIPANFDFIKRTNYILTKKIGGFTDLYKFTTGKPKNNFWGDALTVFSSTTNNPYFFSFHYENLAKIMIFCKQTSRSKIFINFLIAQAQKYNTSIIIAEKQSNSKLFIENLSGTYFENYSEQTNLNDHKICGLNFSSLSPQLLHKVMNDLAEICQSRNGIIISLDTTDFSNSSESAEILNNFLNSVKNTNSVVLLNFESPENLNHINPDHINNFKNKIFLDSQKINQETAEKLLWSKQTIEILKQNIHPKEFILISGENILRLNYALDQLDDFKNILYQQ